MLSFAELRHTVLYKISGPIRRWESPIRRVSNTDYPWPCTIFCSHSLKGTAERHQLTEQQRANTPRQKIFPESKMQQCSSHPPARIWWLAPNWTSLTAPHCSLVLLAQRKSKYCRARICKRRTYRGLWFCWTYPADFGDTFDDNWPGQLVKPCWIWWILFLRKQNPESRNKYFGKGFDCWWWKCSSH